MCADDRRNAIMKYFLTGPIFDEWDEYRISELVDEFLAWLQSPAEENL